MADSQYDQFLQEATTHDAVCSRLPGRNRRCRLHASWCSPSQAWPGLEEVFRAAVKEKQIHPGRAGRRTKGPAAADYILARCPDLV